MATVRCYVEGMSQTAESTKPTVGMGVTLRTGFGGLYVPYTVIAVSASGKQMTIQADTYTPIPDTDDNGDQEYKYSPNPNGEVEVVTLRNDGTWIVKGVPKEYYTTRYYLGYRRHWVDRSM